MNTTTAGDMLRAFDALPFAALDDIIGHGRPLILAPHPDDESLGCGGLIAASCRRGTPPAIVVITDGAGSHPGSRSHPPARLRAVREQEMRDAVTVLGMPAERLTFLRLPDTAAPLAGAAFENAVFDITDRVRAARCDVIVAPWRHDPHCDHEAADAMARAVSRLAGIPHLAYPVWGWTLPPDTKLPDERVAGWRLDIADRLELKRRAIASHATQYADLITDDPAGFRLPGELLAIFDRPYEVFLRA